MSRNENSSTSSANDFLDLISNIFGKGWHGYGPKIEGLDSLLYISFHVNPDKSELLNDLLVNSIGNYNQGF